MRRMQKTHRPERPTPLSIFVSFYNSIRSAAPLTFRPESGAVNPNPRRKARKWRQSTPPTDRLQAHFRTIRRTQGECVAVAGEVPLQGQARGLCRRLKSTAEATTARSGVEVGTRLWYTARKCSLFVGERARPGSSALSWRRRLRSLQSCKGTCSVSAPRATANAPTSVHPKRMVPPSLRPARRVWPASPTGRVSCQLRATTCA